MNKTAIAQQILSKHTGQEGIYLTKGMIRGSDALEAMDEYAAQLPAPKWVRVDNLPKQSMSCLLYLADGRIEMGGYYGDDKMVKHFYLNNYCVDDIVTHYMPQPEPPQDDESNVSPQAAENEILKGALKVELKSNKEYERYTQELEKMLTKEQAEKAFELSKQPKI